jgi:cysteine synthase
MSEEDGRPLSLILYDQLQKNPLDTLRVMGQFIPKEMLVEAQVTTDIEAMSDAELAAYARRLTADLGLSVGIAGAAEATH